MEVKAGYQQTEVGIIPEEWNVGALQDIAHIERGKFTARPRNDPKYFGGEIPFIQTGDVTRSGGNIEAFSQTLNLAGLRVSKLFPKGTLFFTIAANIGDIGISAFDTACPDSLVAISTFRDVDKRWLSQELKSRKRLFEKIASHNAQLNINLDKLRPYKLPIPPAREQNAIAEALSDADALIESLERLVAKKRQIKQGATQELLTGKRRLPGFGGEWGRKRLADLASLSKAGINPADSPKALCTHFSLPAFDAGEVPVVEEGGEIGSNKFLVPEGAVLISKLNPRIPRVWAPKEIPTNAVCSTEFLVLVPREQTDRGYLAAVCMSPDVCYQMELHAIGTTGSHQRINPSQAMSIEVSAPFDRAEQSAIASALLVMESELALLIQKLTKARAIKQGMMQELLTGKTRLI